MATTIKTTYTSLPQSVADALRATGVNPGKVLAGVNAALGQLQLASEETKLGASRLTDKGLTFNQAENVRLSFTGKVNVPLQFKNYCDAIAKLDKQYPSGTIGTLPVQFADWLASPGFKADAGKAGKADAGEAKAKAKAKAPAVPAPAVPAPAV